MSHHLVTGTAGFIASKVSEFLLDDGHTVAGVDNLNDAYDVRLKEWRLDRLQERDGFTFLNLDVVDRDALRTQVFEVNPPEAVINLAAQAGVRRSVEQPELYLDTNFRGTLHLLELCREFDVPKFILASTSSAYGEGNDLPYREDQDTSRPLSPYAATKKAAEAMCYTYHYLHGIDVTVFRYFTVYGPAGRPDMAPFRFAKWITEGTTVTIFGDGKQSRDFTYVDDIARGTIAGLKPLGYEIINLGNDEPVELMTFLQEIERAVGKKANLEFQPRHKADVTATWANISKAERLLGWRPQFDFRKGVEQLVQWYRANRAWASEIET